MARRGTLPPKSVKISGILVDFYDGGEPDIAFLLFAEVDPSGDVNISQFGSAIVGGFS